MSIPAAEKRIEEFEKLAFGMFIHYDLGSLLERGICRLERYNTSDQEFERLKNSFTAEDFDGRAIGQLAKRAGMKYVCMVARHHLGFSMYDTQGLSDFDVMHCSAGRDLVKDFVEGCRAEGIVPFLYHTTPDCYQESYKKDFESYLDYLHGSLELLCTNYGPIGGLWFDGNWDKPGEDWKEDRLYGMIRKHQPDAIITNNTGLAALGATGHPEIDCLTYERNRPVPLDRDGMEKYLAVEMNDTSNMYWFYAKNDFCVRPVKEIIETLCACRKTGANYLLNIAPTASGKLPELESAVVSRVGEWIGMHGDILYNGRPTDIVCPGDDFVLEADGKLYLFVHNLTIEQIWWLTPAVERKGPLALAKVDRPIKSVRWVDSGEQLAFSQNLEAGIFTVNATGYPYGTHLAVRIAELA